MEITLEFFESVVKIKGKKKVKQQLITKQPHYRLCCAVCGTRITDNQQQAEVDGCHSHSKTNPDNQQFLIRCFILVENCKVNGEKISLNSWFSGYQWQFVQCKSCSTQLGWYFSGGRSFYGLIEEQLVICDD